MSLVTKALWGMQGFYFYTRLGYSAAAKGFHDGTPPPLNDRSFMITGANSGIGFETARSLAQRGATVHLVCRNKSRGLSAQHALVEQTKNQKVFAHCVDLSSMREIHKFAKSFGAAGTPLDVLINNSGPLLTRRQVTEEGLDYSFATNSLGPYVLTTALKDVLLRSQSPRVINMSSAAVLLDEHLSANDPQLTSKSFDSLEFGAQHKRQQHVFMESLAANPSFAPIRFYLTHPGWTATPSVQQFLPAFDIILGKLLGLLRTPAEGADTCLWLATGDDLPVKYNGQFFQDRRCIQSRLSLWSSKTAIEHSDIQTFLEYMDRQVAKYSSEHSTL